PGRPEHPVRVPRPGVRGRGVGDSSGAVARRHRLRAWQRRRERHRPALQKGPAAMRRPVLVVVLALVGAVGLPACAQPGDGGYRLTADFSRAVALYPRSRVKVMGVDVGTVRSIDVVRGHIRVALRIDRKVPLPANVQATIVPFSLIGERNVVLSPAWQPGQARAKDGDAIPAERTHVPVEPDEALKAVTDLAHAVDPDAVRKLVSSGAAALRGRGPDLNTAIEQAADLTTLL